MWSESNVITLSITNVDIAILFQVQVERLGQPYGECIDTLTGTHDIVKNVYEELFPYTYYSVSVSHLVYKHPERL